MVVLLFSSIFCLSYFIPCGWHSIVKPMRKKVWVFFCIDFFFAKKNINIFITTYCIVCYSIIVIKNESFSEKFFSVIVLFSWKRNNVPLERRPNIKVRNKDHFSRLTIVDLEVLNSGFYECIATNSAGTVKTGSKLKVSSVFSSCCWLLAKLFFFVELSLNSCWQKKKKKLGALQIICQK